MSLCGAGGRLLVKDQVYAYRKQILSGSFELEPCLCRIPNIWQASSALKNLFPFLRSLGVLLYTLVYGAMPFDGSNFKRLVKQITTGDYYEPKQPSCECPKCQNRCSSIYTTSTTK